MLYYPTEVVIWLLLQALAQCFVCLQDVMVVINGKCTTHVQDSNDGLLLLICASEHVVGWICF